MFGRRFLHPVASLEERRRKWAAEDAELRMYCRFPSCDDPMPPYVIEREPPDLWQIALKEARKRK